jgi:hypothetical protein
MTNKLEQQEYKCPYCDIKYDELNSLQRHFSRKHKETSRQLYVLLFCNGTEPTCACGCGAKLKYHNINFGFSTYRQGHIARIKNNWGHNEEALKKSQDVRRVMFKNGEIRIWCKGKDKNDPDIAKMIEKGRNTVLSNPVEIQKRSKRMSEQRLSGVIPTLYGKDHSQWRGGTSALQAICRSHVFNAWSYHKMKESNFTCQNCGISSGHGVELNVHHNQEKFADILYKAIQELGEVQDDNFEHKTLIAEWVTKYHIENDVSGIVLCKECHDKMHDKRV